MYSSNLGELLIVLEEESQVLVRDVDFGISTEFPVLLHGRLSSTESIFVDLVLDHLGRVRHEDGGRVNRSGHLGLSAEQRGDKLGVDESRLLVLEARGDFSGEAEVRVLVDGAGDEAGDVGLGAEDLGERVGEGGGGLDRDEVPLSDVVPVGEWISECCM